MPDLSLNKLHITTESVNRGDRVFQNIFFKIGNFSE